MDVEKIQKINKLALDLERQGLVSNRDEAIAQAEKVFSSENSEAYNSIKDNVDNDRFNPQITPKDNEKPLSEDKIKTILEQNSSFLVRKIKEFQEKIEMMENEVGVLKDKIAQQKIPTIGELMAQSKSSTESVASASQEPQVNEAPAQPQAPTKEEINKDVPKNHPRSGTYKDDDVSIEKFFYMGSK